MQQLEILGAYFTRDRRADYFEGKGTLALAHAQLPEGVGYRQSFVRNKRGERVAFSAPEGRYSLRRLRVSVSTNKYAVEASRDFVKNPAAYNYDPQNARLPIFVLGHGYPGEWVTVLHGVDHPLGKKHEPPQFTLATSLLSSVRFLRRLSEDNGPEVVGRVTDDFVLLPLYPSDPSERLPVARRRVEVGVFPELNKPSPLFGDLAIGVRRARRTGRLQVEVADIF